MNFFQKCEKSRLSTNEKNPQKFDKFSLNVIIKYTNFYSLIKLKW